MRTLCQKCGLMIDNRGYAQHVGSCYGPTCRNPGCDTRRTLRKFIDGYCRMCARYLRLYGKMRPTEIMRTHMDNQCTCIRCHQAPAYSKHLCIACYNYQLVHKCRNCERPLDRSSGRAIGRAATARRGRCRTCAQYYLRTGAERPERLWKVAADLGWCDCGNPATRRMELSFGGANESTERSDTYALCEDCYELEMEP